MPIALDYKIVTGTVRRFGFKSRTQWPIFMVWEEDWHEGEIQMAWVLFSTSDYRPCRILQRLIQRRLPCSK